MDPGSPLDSFDKLRTVGIFKSLTAVQASSFGLRTGTAPTAWFDTFFLRKTLPAVVLTSYPAVAKAKADRWRAGTMSGSLRTKFILNSAAIAYRRGGHGRITLSVTSYWQELALFKMHD